MYREITSLSLYIYIYIHMYTRVQTQPAGCSEMMISPVIQLLASDNHNSNASRVSNPISDEYIYVSNHSKSIILSGSVRMQEFRAQGLEERSNK